MSDLNDKLMRASQFSYEELAAAYNQARVDYLVPMPTDAARLAEYVRLYDVDLDHSWIAVDGGQIFGLAMLGVRPGRTWITRLGVLPNRRRHGTGEVLVRALLASAQELCSPLSVLEVIKGNHPAHDLFLKLGFFDTRELLILQRAPGIGQAEPRGKATWLKGDEALSLHPRHADRPAWTNELETYINAGDAQGLVVDLGPSGQGWMIFRRQAFRLSHFILHTDAGNPVEVAFGLLVHLYKRYPSLETYLENISADDPHLPALIRFGFGEVFRRIEMYRRSH